MAPHGGRFENGQGLQQTLGDDAELDVRVIGAQLAAHGVPIVFRLHVQVLIA